MRIPAGSILIFPGQENVLEFYKLIANDMEKLGLDSIGIIIEPSYVVANKYNTNNSIWVAIPPLTIVIPGKAEIMAEQKVRYICDSIGYCFVTRRDSWGEVEFIRLYDLLKLISYFSKTRNEQGERSSEVYELAGIKIEFNIPDYDLCDHEFIIISAIEKTNASGFVSRRPFLDSKYEKTINKAMKEYVDSIPIAFYANNKECLPAVIVRGKETVVIDVYMYERYRAELFVTVLLTLLQLLH